MKKIFYLLSFILIAVMQSCDKDGPGDNYDVTNSVAPYVRISNRAARKANPGTTVNIALDMRTSIQEEVTATYSLTGAVNTASATVVFAREAKTVNVPIVIPAGATGSVVLSLTKAVTASGKELTIGFNNAPSLEKVTVNIESAPL